MWFIMSCMFNNLKCWQPWCTHANRAQQRHNQLEKNTAHRNNEQQQKKHGD